MDSTSVRRGCDMKLVRDGEDIRIIAEDAGDDYALEVFYVLWMCVIPGAACAWLLYETAYAWLYAARPGGIVVCIWLVGTRFAFSMRSPE